MKRFALLVGMMAVLYAQTAGAGIPGVDINTLFVSATDSVYEDRVEVRWSRVPFDTVTYRILRDGSLLSVASSRDSLYSDFSGVPGVTCEYCVVMTDSTNPSIGVTLCDDGSRVIFPPRDVSASDGLFEDKVRITWTDYSLVERGYQIKRDGTQIATTPANTEAFDDTAAIINVIYTYEITAFDADGHSSRGVTDTGFRGALLPPRSVSASDGLYADRVEITWIDQTELEVGYIVLRDDVRLDTTAANAASYTDLTAVFGTAYTYCVASLHAGGDESVKACDEGGTGILPPPINVRATDGDYDDRVEVSWEVHSDLQDGFIISRDGTVLDSTSAQAVSYNDATATHGQTYTYCVQAYSDSGGVSAVECTSGRRAVVVAPQNVAATDGDFEDHVQITWESISTTAVLFKVYRAGTLIVTLPGTDRTYSDDRGTAGVEYQYSLRAVTAMDVASDATYDNGYRELKSPSNVKASDDAYEPHVLVTWVDDSQYESGYHIYRNSGLIGSISSNRTSYLDETGVPGTTYTYSVAAYDTMGLSLGESDRNSDEGRRTLNPPTNVQATDGAYENKVVITWEDNSGAEKGYRIYRNNTAIGTTADNTWSYTDTSPAFGVAQNYKVAAFDNYGESTAGSDSGYTTILAPASFNASDTYEDEVVLAWIDVSNIESGYKIYRDGSLLKTTGANVITWTDTTAAEGVEYEYCIASYNGSAASDRVCDTGIIPPSYIPGNRINELTKIIAGDGSAIDVFGNAVATSGDRAIVGASDDDPGGLNDAGSAYIFVRSESGWSQQAKLTASDGAAGDNFGFSVAISGDVAVVGAPYDDDKGTSAGAAYVFQWNGSSWNQAKMLDTDGTEFDYFGSSVAISRDLIVIGAHGDEAGSVFIFERVGLIWVRRAKITVGDGAGAFGFSVAIDGETVVVYDMGVPSSYVYILKRSGALWNRQARITDCGQGNPMTIFYRLVSIDEDLILVSNVSDEKALVYRQNGTSWSREAELTAGDVASSTLFGCSVGISNGVAVVGALGDDEKGNGAGAAYVFASGCDGWTELAKLTTGDGAADDQFGNAVAIDDHIVIGARGDDDNGNYSGSAYITDVVPPTPPAMMSASDGTFNGRVQIKWKDMASNEDGYHVFRDGQLIEETGPDVQSYNDYDIQPGLTYRYSVASYKYPFESAQICDFGRTPPNGNITGRVATRSGASVEGVSVCLDPAPGKGLLLDGQGGYVCIPDDDTFDFESSDDFTIEVWVKYSGNGGSGSGDGSIIEKWSGGGPYSFVLRNRRYYAKPGQLAFGMYDGSQGPSVLTTRQDLNDNTWHHIACRHDAAQKRVSICIDGQETNHSTYTSLGTLSNNSDLFFGRRGNASNEWFGGQLDEVRIWNTVRTDAEIQAMMSQPLTGQEEGLLGCWPFDQGIGTIATDLTAGAHYGTFQGGAFWTEEGAPLEVCALTDLEGNYVLRKIPYGLSTTFQITPSLGPRQFEPAFKTITLSTGNPVQNEVGFVDISSFTVSGDIKYQDTGCFVANAEMLVDGTVAGTTDKNGKYAIPVQVGEHEILPRLSNHTFSPPQYGLDVSGNVAGINFINTTMRTLTVTAQGGCGLSIGTATFRVFSESGCLTMEQDVDGQHDFTLPPQKYVVQISDVDPPSGLDKADILKFFDHLGTKEVDLTSADTTIDFTYRAPLRIVIDGFPYPSCSPLRLSPTSVITGVSVITQGDQVPLTIEVCEDYGAGGLCPVDTGIVTIYDEIIDEEDTPVELPIKDGMAFYTTAGNTPNIAAGRVDAYGRDRSYQKAFTVIAEVEGLSPETHIEWVLVTGHRPRTASFTAVSEGIPILILRDPPGDGSNSYVEKGESFCTNFSNLGLESAATGIHTKVKGGLRFTKGTPFWSTETQFEMETENKFLIGLEATQEGGLQICATTTERFSTSGGDVFVGDDGDVYLGVALNLIFAKTDVIDVANCEVEKSVQIAMGGDGFETTYLFTEGHIRDYIIPQLEELAELVPDSSVMFSSAAQNWNDHLAFNDSLKTAATFRENRSFSAGADYEYSHSSDTTSTFKWSVKAFTSNELALGFVFDESGTGTQNQFLVNLAFSYTRSQSRDTTWSRTVGYTLTDDDIGDYFTVDVKDDPFYGTPVFALRSGTSCCPWEPGTQKRTDALVSITPPARLDVPPDQPATFTLGLTNMSESGEQWMYDLRPVNTSNPGGAVLKVNGAPLSAGPLIFFLAPYQTQEVTLTVERGPTRYNYEGLAVMVTSPCEYDYWMNTGVMQIADTAYFDVRFEAPCSDIVLFRPLPGWSFNRQDHITTHDSLELILDDFENQISEEDYLERIGAQYRRLNTDVWSPVPGSEIDSSALKEGTSERVFWNLSTIEDGTYELRAYTRCEGGNGFSSIAVGTIDRQPPEVFGTPEPSDGILSYGEDISVTFNEPIKCSSILADSVLLTYTHSGQQIAINTVCDGQTIILKPKSYSNLEDSLLTARVEGIRDLVGNPMASSQSWTFVVRRDQFAWNQGSLVRTVAYDSPGSFAAELVNGNPGAIHYDITGCPAWLTPDPSSGEFFGAGIKEITFAIQEDLALGIYTGTVTATAGVKMAQFAVTCSVKCVSPSWSVKPGDYAYNMSITAELLLPSEGGVSCDTNDVVAAYVGDLLRGSARVTHVPGLLNANPGDSDPDTCLVYLIVYSNLRKGETIHFRIWNDSQCEVYPNTSKIFTFNADTSLGTPTRPVQLVAPLDWVEKIQDIDFNTGWTWFSTYIVHQDMTPTEVLSGLNPVQGDLIKSQSAFSEYIEDPFPGWVGDIEQLDNESCYMVKATNGGVLTLYGPQALPAMTPIALASGWNWIGYVPNCPLDVKTALGHLSGILKNGDLIKSQYEFAQYTGGNWYGSLRYMQPGLGYKLLMAGSGQFTYPDCTTLRPDVETEPLAFANAAGTQITSGKVLGGQNGPGWEVDPHAYQYNMTVTGVIEIDGVESMNAENTIGAFVEGECRGVAQAQYVEGLNRSLAFLMIFSNSAAGENFTFRVFDAEAEVIRPVDETLIFSADETNGSVAEPFVFNAGSVLSVDVAHDRLIPDEHGLGQNYPNPFNPTTSIQFAVGSGQSTPHVTLKVFNLLGQEVATLVDRVQEPGYFTAAWDARDMASGVYFYRLTAGEFSETKKMVLMK